MIVKDIGYMICESAIPGFTDTNIVKEENGRVIAEGILQTANEKNIPIVLEPYCWIQVPHLFPRT